MMVLAQAAQEAKETASGIPWPQIILAIVGPAGLIGSVVALFKLKPDANTAAVSQAQGAAAEWKSIADDRKSEIAEKEKRIDELEGKLVKSQRENDQLRRRETN